MVDSRCYDGTCHKIAEVHMCSIRVNHLREKPKNKDKYAITNTKNVEQDPPDRFRKMKEVRAVNNTLRHALKTFYTTQEPRFSCQFNKTT